MRVKVPYTQFIDIEIDDSKLLTLASKVISNQIGGYVWNNEVRDFIYDTFVRVATEDDLEKNEVMNKLALYKGDKHCG